jgi:hypothetical protein
MGVAFFAFSEVPVPVRARAQAKTRLACSLRRELKGNGGHEGDVRRGGWVANVHNPAGAWSSRIESRSKAGFCMPMGNAAVVASRPTNTIAEKLGVMTCSAEATVPGTARSAWCLGVKSGPAGGTHGWRLNAKLCCLFTERKVAPIVGKDQRATPR